MYAKVAAFDNATYDRTIRPPLEIKEFTGPATYVITAIAEWQSSDPRIKSIEIDELTRD